MSVTVIPTVVEAPATATNGLEKGFEQLEIGGRIKIIQTTVLFRSAKILRRVQEICGDLLLPTLKEKPISLCWCENPGNNKIIIFFNVVYLL